MFILIEKERKKTVCEAIFREIIFVYIRSATRPSRDNQIFSPSWVYHTFFEGSAAKIEELRKNIGIKITLCKQFCRRL